MVTFLSVRVTHNTKKVISTFSGDRSRCVNLFQHVPETNNEPGKSQCGHVPPTILHTLIYRVLCHEKIGMGICL